MRMEDAVCASVRRRSRTNEDSCPAAGRNRPVHRGGDPEDEIVRVSGCSNHVGLSGRARSTMPGQDADMELCTDKVLSKERILQELTKAVKLVSRTTLYICCHSFLNIDC